MTLKIDQLNESKELKPVDISQWNKDVKGYVRPLSGIEYLIFNDYFLTFINQDLDPEKRFEAGFKASLMALVYENGQPLLVPESRQDMWNASIFPILNIFSAVIKGMPPTESAKKN